MSRIDRDGVLLGLILKSLKSPISRSVMLSPVKKDLSGGANGGMNSASVSYTHLTLPTN